MPWNHLPIRYVAICFVAGTLCWISQSSSGQGNGNIGPQPRQVAVPANRAAQNGPPVAGQSDPALAQPPEGFALSPQEQQWVDQVLAYWEQNTKKINTYSCQFKRWEYDPVFGPKDSKTAKSISEGEIKYAAPDKGAIQVTSIQEYNVAQANYVARPESGEHWVCDGKSVFEFDHEKRLLIETRLPADMQGSAIANSPLPFLFGADAAKIKERYWVRELPSPDGKPKYYQLEIIPRRRQDAASYLKVQLFLDTKGFRPVGMRTFELNGQSYSSYQFTNIKENGLVANIQNFMKSFVSPKVPRDYTKLTHNLGDPIPHAPAAQAQRPASAEAVPPRR